MARVSYTWPMNKIVKQLNKIARRESARKAARPKRLPAGSQGEARSAERRSSGGATVASFGGG